MCLAHDEVKKRNIKNLPIAKSSEKGKKADYVHGDSIRNISRYRMLSRNRLIGSNTRYVIRELLHSKVFLGKYQIIDIVKDNRIKERNKISTDDVHVIS